MTTTMTQLAAVPDNFDLDYFYKTLGRFNRRMLAEEIGLFSTAEAKQSYMSLDDLKQAEAVYAMVSQLRKKSTGGAASASPRQPSNKGTKKGTNGTAAAPAAAATAAPTAPAASGKGIGEGAAAVLERLDTLTSAVKEQTNAINNLAEAIAVTQGIASGTNRFTTLSIGLSLKLAEQVLGASPENVLRIVLEDMAAVEGALASLAPAGEEAEADGGDEEEEEEEDEGNE